MFYLLKKSGLHLRTLEVEIIFSSNLNVMETNVLFISEYYKNYHLLIWPISLAEQTALKARKVQLLKIHGISKVRFCGHENVQLNL